MRRKTYAYNSVIIGVLVGILAYVSTENIVLGVLACLGVSIVGFVVIKLIENAVYAGVDKAVDAASNAIQKRKQNTSGQTPQQRAPQQVNRQYQQNPQNGQYQQNPQNQQNRQMPRQ